MVLRRLICVCLFGAVAGACVGDSAVACDLCRRYALESPHVEPIGAAAPIGGDALDDAMTDPADIEPSEGGSASFVLQGGKWSQPGGLGTSITLTYSFQNMFDGGLKMPNGQPLPNQLIRKSIEEAMGLWASVAPLNFVEVPDDGLPYGSSTQYGQIRFRHIYLNGPDPPPPALPIAKAQAYFPSSGPTFAGDVEYDHADPWQEVGTLPVPDILGATIHELGHSLGLGHTDLPETNMYWIFTRTAGLGTGKLHADDIAGIRAIYGSGTGSVVSLVPEPTIGVLFTGAGIAWLLRFRRDRDGRAI
jgi:hypothetical protein